MILKGKKVFLRSTFFDDADHLYIWENDKANWNVSGTKKPPNKPPKTPIIMVTIHPPGSFPGIIILAIAPAIKPNIIHVIIPINIFF